MKTVFTLLFATAAFLATTTGAKAQGYYHAPVCNNNYGNGYTYNNYGHERNDAYRIEKDKDRLRRDFFTGNVFALHHDRRDLQDARRDLNNREDHGRYDNRRW